MQAPNPRADHEIQIFDGNHGLRSMHDRNPKYAVNVTRLKKYALTWSGTEWSEVASF